MDIDETMVEQTPDTEVDDTLPEGIEEEQGEPEEEALESLDEGEQEEPQPEEEPPQTEPGWIKKRVNKAVERAVAETERRMREEFEQQMAPIRDKMLTDEAKELVRQGEFKSLERAKEYLQLKQSAAPVKVEQPRNEQGQFTQKSDPAINARVEMLDHQAKAIKERTGLDVISVFENDPDIKRKVVNNEMDFYDVAEQMQKPKKRPPSPMRSPNGASGKTNSFADMSDEQFARIEKRINEGARFKI